MPKQLPTSKNDGKPFLRGQPNLHTTNSSVVCVHRKQTTFHPSYQARERPHKLMRPKLFAQGCVQRGFPNPPPPTHIGVRNLIMFIFNHGDVPARANFHPPILGGFWCCSPSGGKFINHQHAPRANKQSDNTRLMGKSTSSLLYLFFVVLLVPH